MRRLAALTAILVIALTGCTGQRPGGPASPSGPAAPITRWRPGPGTTWQWQLSGKADTSVIADVYDLDVDDTPAATVAALHALGRKVICYVNVGAAEDFRDDAGAFPPVVLGKGNGWEGERWLDIRRRDVLEPIMAARFDRCRDKGFDAVEPDNVDGYANETGFPLRAADQLAYNRLVADLAHARGLSAGLKNDLDQIPQLVADFDFAVSEQCFEFSECEALLPFVEAGKAVFVAEYAGSTASFCPLALRLGLSAMLKGPALDARRETC